MKGSLKCTAAPTASQGLPYKGCTINGNLLRCPFGQTDSKVLFHHGNVAAHKGRIVQDKLQIVAHPVYSSDPVTTDFQLFPELKLLLSGKKFK